MGGNATMLPDRVGPKPARILNTMLLAASGSGAPPLPSVGSDGASPPAAVVPGPLAGVAGSDSAGGIDGMVSLGGAASSHAASAMSTARGVKTTRITPTISASPCRQPEELHSRTNDTVKPF